MNPGKIDVCPACGYTAWWPTGLVVKPGAVTMCLSCGEALEVGKDGLLAVGGDATIEAMPERTQALMRKFQEVIRERGPLERQNTAEA